VRDSNPHDLSVERF